MGVQRGEADGDQIKMAALCVVDRADPIGVPSDFRRFITCFQICSLICPLALAQDRFARTPWKTSRLHQVLFCGPP